MAILYVGKSAEYSSIASAVAASGSGDTINVEAGTYTNDFTHIDHSLTLQAIGGMVTMAATVQSPDRKAILTEGGSGADVRIDGFAFTGATVSDENGAGIRYEGGRLTIENSHFYGNQNGILGASDPNGVITISRSEFDHNGIGDGHTHNIYIGDINSFTLTGSFTHDANVGHEIESRAENNTFTNNRIFDNDSTSSYEIDLPSGGNATISANIIEQGANSQNPNIIAYGEEGNLYAGTALSITGNTIVNDKGAGPALWNASGSTVAGFSNNAVYGFGDNALVRGLASQSDTIVLGSRPALDQSVPYGASPARQPAPTPVAAAAPTPAPFPAPAPSPTPTQDTPVVNPSEGAYLRDAQFTVSMAGVQQGGPQTATAPPDSNGTATVPVGYVPNPTPNPAPAAVAAPAPAPAPASDLAPAAISTDTLTLYVSEDAWLGDAQFLVSLDGQQLGGTGTATASHALGEVQALTFEGAFGIGPHDLAVAFINDAWGGTPDTDRNLYVTSVDYNGANAGQYAAVLYGNGAAHFEVGNSASNVLSPPVPLQ